MDNIIEEPYWVWQENSTFMSLPCREATKDLLKNFQDKGVLPKLSFGTSPESAVEQMPQYRNVAFEQDFDQKILAQG